MCPRPEVVQAIMDAQLEMDPSALAGIDHTTLEERRLAEDDIAQVYLARQPDEHRRAHAWEVLASTRFASEGLSWGRAWDALTEAQREEFVALYDVLPEQLLPHVDAYREERS